VQEFDDFLAEIRQFVEYLENASVHDSANFRLHQMIDHWKQYEARMITLRYSDISRFLLMMNLALQNLTVVDALCIYGLILRF
jgi:hypothetical protein